MGFNDFLEKWVISVENTKKELVFWAYKDGSMPGKSFWSKHILDVIFYSLFIVLGLISFFCDWNIVLFIILFVIGIKLLGVLWNLIKKIWNSLKNYLLEKR